MNRRDLAYPSSEMAARFQKLPAPTSDVKASLAAGRAGCEELQKFITTWPSWLFARGDAAFGGAGDESPLIISEKSLKVEGDAPFPVQSRRAWRARRARRPDSAAVGKLYLNVAAVNPAAKGKPVIIWRNPTVAFALRCSAVEQRRRPKPRSTPMARPIPMRSRKAVAASGSGCGRGRGGRRLRAFRCAPW